MAVVTKTTYENLADYIGNAYAAASGAAPYITSGLEEVVNLDDADQEYDMLSAWYNTNQTSVVSTDAFISIASSLQNHVELRNGTTVAAFLTAQSILVSADFAAVSKDAGYDVDAFIAP